MVSWLVLREMKDLLREKRERGRRYTRRVEWGRMMENEEISEEMKEWKKDVVIKEKEGKENKIYGVRE